MSALNILNIEILKKLKWLDTVRKKKLVNRTIILFDENDPKLRKRC